MTKINFDHDDVITLTDADTGSHCEVTCLQWV